jgi:hypothetical protein
MKKIWSIVLLLSVSSANTALAVNHHRMLKSPEQQMVFNSMLPESRLSNLPDGKQWGRFLSILNEQAAAQPMAIINSRLVVQMKSAEQREQKVTYAKHTCGAKRKWSKQLKETTKQRGTMDPMTILFIIALAVLIASLLVGLFELVFLNIAAILAIIRWVFFGVGIALLSAALVYVIILLEMFCSEIHKCFAR